MTRRTRGRLIMVLALMALVATVLNIGRTDGWLDAAKITGMIGGCYLLLTMIITWERRGKP